MVVMTVEMMVGWMVAVLVVMTGHWKDAMKAGRMVGLLVVTKVEQ